ncbi:MAG: hypothetical protein WCF90_07650 [Methanomicrobiales archaeon]
MSVGDRTAFGVIMAFTPKGLLYHKNRAGCRLDDLLDNNEINLIFHHVLHALDSRFFSRVTV